MEKDSGKWNRKNNRCYDGLMKEEEKTQPAEAEL